MWLLRIFLLTCIVVVLVMVAVQNHDPLVNVQLFQFHFEQVRLFVVMFAAVTLGFIAGLLVAAIRELQMRMRLSSERKSKDALEREVRDLRAAPIAGLGDDGRQLPGAPR